MYSVFRDLAIIILSAKFFALVARKCKAPQVVGEIIAGLIIGPCLLNLVQTSDAISIFAEIGVVRPSSARQSLMMSSVSSC